MIQIVKERERKKRRNSAMVRKKLGKKRTKIKSSCILGCEIMKIRVFCLLSMFLYSITSTY